MKKSSDPEASVIIPAYEESEWIEDTLNSLEEQEAEVIVVASGEDTMEAAKHHSATDKVKEDEFEEGWGVAVNQGILESTKDIVAILDADTLAPEDWLKNHLKHYSEPEIVGVGGPAVARESGFHRITWNLYTLYILPLLWKLGFKLAIGNNCSYRRELLEEVGKFNEEMEFLEDVEIALRMDEEGDVIFDRGIRTKTSIRRVKDVGNISTLQTYAKGHWNYFFRNQDTDVEYH